MEISILYISIPRWDINTNIMVIIINRCNKKKKENREKKKKENREKKKIKQNLAILSIQNVEKC